MDGPLLSRRALALRLAPGQAVAAVAALAGALTLWNALAYPVGAGYDASAHLSYSDYLLAHHALPERSGSWEYYSPPLYYILAAIASEVGRLAGAGQPDKLAQLLNVPMVVGSVLLVAAFARLLWPRRPWAAAAAAAFVALSPVLERTAAMFHPEPLDLLLATASAYLAARLLRRRDDTVRGALALGVVLGLAQMVRQFALYTLAVVALAWLVALVARRAERRRLLRAGAIALAAVVVVAGPWYGYRQAHGGNALFDRPTRSTPFFERRPASFYLGTGLPAVFTRPYRTSFANEAWPQTYSDLWGDWYGAFAWDADRRAPDGTVRDWLVVQNAVGIVPTILALAGWLVLLGGALRRRAAPELLAALVPLAGLAGYLYFAIGYPTPSGDVLKPAFMLSTLWGWALCFAWAAVRLAERRPRLVGTTLGLLALVDLPFLVYRGAVGWF